MLLVLWLSTAIVMVLVGLYTLHYVSSSTSLGTVSISLLLTVLLGSGITSTLTSINFLVIMCLRSCGMLIARLTIIVVSIMCVSVLLIMCLPILTSALLLIALDLHMNLCVFDSSYGGDSVCYQHLFWIFGHPEVYLLILPSFGMVRHILSSLSCTKIVGNVVMPIALVAICLLGLVVWGHHMLIVGLEVDSLGYF